MVLTLVLQHRYYDEVVSGKKRFEYRQKTPYWSNRLKKSYSQIRFIRGYTSTSTTFEFKSIEEEVITHPFFDNKPTPVFKIGIGRRL